MSFIYKTVYYPANPKAEYQKQGKMWVKRAKGSKGEFYAVEVDNGKILDKEFAQRGSLYFYNDTLKIGLGLAVVGIVYLLYRKTMKAKKVVSKPI